jgi:hypothetical protein
MLVISAAESGGEGPERGGRVGAKRNKAIINQLLDLS